MIYCHYASGNLPRSVLGKNLDGQQDAERVPHPDDVAGVGLLPYLEVERVLCSQIPPPYGEECHVG